MSQFCKSSRLQREEQKGRLGKSGSTSSSARQRGQRRRTATLYPRFGGSWYPLPVSPNPSSSRREERRQSFWVASTYFAEGFPYSIVNSVAEVVFKDLGSSLGAVGLTSLFHLPWNLKFLWAPVVERWGRLRSWILGLEGALAFTLAGIGFVIGRSEGAPSQESLGALAVLFLALAFFSATHDVAIDGHYLEALPPSAQARHVGLRVGAYKLSSLAARGPLLLVVQALGWAFGFWVMSAALLLLLGLHAWFLPRARARQDRSPQEVFTPSLFARVAHLGSKAFRWRLGFGLLGLSFLGWASARVSVVFAPLVWLRSLPLSLWVSVVLLLLLGVGMRFRERLSVLLGGRGALVEMTGRPRFGWALAFVITFRLGESFLQKMKWPFLSDVLGMSKGEYGVLNGTLGVLVSFGATYLGGRLIARDGLSRWFWPFIWAQNGSNLAYALLGEAPNLGGGLVLAGGVLLLEEFGSGLGTSILTVYLMRLCYGERKATQFALLTALMSLGFTFAGTVSGFVAELVGYTWFFVGSFILTWPMMLFARRIPTLEQ